MGNAEIAKPRSRRRKIVLRALCAFLLVCAVFAVVLLSRYYTDPERIRVLAEDYLQRYTHGRATIGSADFSWFGGVLLFDVAVTDTFSPMGTQSSAELNASLGKVETSDVSGTSDTSGVSSSVGDTVFSCRRLELGFDLWAALFGNLKVESLLAIGPECLIVHNALDGRTNLARLLQRVGSASGPTSLPTIELRNARIRVIDRNGDQDRIVEDMTLTLRGRPAPRTPRIYDVAWHGGQERVANGRSQIDLGTGHVRNVRGGLPWMSIEAVMLAVNAQYDGAGAWCSLLGLGGTVRARDYNLIGPSEIHGPRSATIDLDHAALSIPIAEAERTLPRGERYLRFEEVTGSVEVTGKEIRATFDGLFHGSRCSVSAVFLGGVDKLSTLEDVGFDVRGTVEALELPRIGAGASPDQDRFVNRLSRLADLYDRYEPHGVVDLAFEALKHPGADQPVTLRNALISAKGADFSLRRFPYRLKDLTGTVEYTPDRVFVRSVRGTHAGGIVTIDGWADKKSRDTVAELTITGTNIPVDDDLRAPLSRHHQKMIDTFAPAGLIDFNSHLTRSASVKDQPARWYSNTTATFDDLRATYLGFPYTFENLSGTVEIGPEAVAIIGLRGRAGEGSITADGDVAFRDGELTALEISITGEDVVIDEQLLSALPPAYRDQIEAFHGAGRFDSQTRLTYDARQKRVVHASDIRLEDVAIEHERFPVPIVGIHGDVRVISEGVIVKRMQGRYGEGFVSVEGVVSRSGTASREDAGSDEDAANREGTVSGGETDLRIVAQGITLDDSLRAALPPRLREALAAWSVEDPIDGEVFLSRRPSAPGPSWTVRAVARLDGVTVEHAMLSAPLEDVRAELKIGESGFRAVGVEARYGSATIKADIEVRERESGYEGTLALAVIGLPLSEIPRELLPPDLRSAWEGMKPQGVVDLHIEQLELKPSGASGSRVCSVTGRVDLVDVAFAGIMDLAHVSGSITLTGLALDRLGGTTLSGELDLQTVELLARKLETVVGSWSFARTADGRGRLAVDPVQGTVYDGTLAGRIEFLFDKRVAEFDLSATVQDMQIEPFSNAGRAPGSKKAKPVDVQGLADAQLYLSGVIGDPSSLRGGGRVEIFEARMYRLPIVLAILNVINLSVPDNTAFDEAWAEFFVLGRRVELKDILLRGNALALVGNGTMTLPDQSVDLSLINVTPRNWVRVPLVTDIVEGAARGLVELRVTGPLFQPRVTAQPLPGFRDELKRLFKKKQPSRTQPEKR